MHAVTIGGILYEVYPTRDEAEEAAEPLRSWHTGRVEIQAVNPNTVYENDDGMIVLMDPAAYAMLDKSETTLRPVRREA